jgi:hypothetical protein
VLPLGTDNLVAPAAADREPCPLPSLCLCLVPGWVQGSKYIDQGELCPPSPSEEAPTESKLDKGGSAALPGDSAHNGAEAFRT